jgi:predicted negative regulator of RcsB-dependent stress response
MEIVLFVKKENLNKVEEILKKNEKTSMLSILIRDGKYFGYEDFIIYLNGLEEYIRIALEITKDLVKVAKEEEKNRIIEKLKEEEQKAFESFGEIFKI